MTTRALGLGKGWSWLMSAFNLGRNNPRAVIGSIMLLMLVALVPSIIQLVSQSVLGAQPGAILGVAVVTTLLSIVVFPLLVGGVLRVIDSAERRLPTHATAVFDTFKSGNGAGRLIGLGILMTALYLLVIGFIVGLFGNGLFDWYAQLMTLTMESGGKPLRPEDIPPAPDGLATVMALGLLFALFFGGMYAIGFGQVALGGRGVFPALADGLTGALKNLLPITVLAILLCITFFAAMLVAGLIGGLILLIGSLIHPSFGAILALPIYLGLLLLIYVVMFGVMYFMWRDVCEVPPTPSEPPRDRVEL